MEADWSIELGAGLARIDVPWRGDGVGGGLEFIDLIVGPDLAAAISAIQEARDEPALFHALLRLNGPGSPVLTSKCDAWLLKEDEIDPFEFDAAGFATAGRASYVDFVFRDAALFISLKWHERWMHRVTSLLRNIALRSARIDFVLREAEVRGVEGFGITLYVMGCGRDSASAKSSWESALDAAAEAICGPQCLSAPD